MTVYGKYRPGFLAGILAGFLVMSLAMLSCESMQFSPYETHGRDNPGSRTSRQLEQLQSPFPVSPDSFTFAVVGDPGQQLDGLHAAVRDVNNRKDIRFLLVAGDLTQYGLRREFDWVVEILEELEVPYLTTVGNHDGLANGPGIYREVFGPYDYSFTYGNSKFLVMNTNSWEFGKDVPDFDFLERELSDSRNFAHVLLFSHIAPFDGAFSDDDEADFRSLLNRHAVSLSMHGHAHSFHVKAPYDDGIPYLIVDDAGGRNYALVHVRGDSVLVERRFF